MQIDLKTLATSEIEPYQIAYIEAKSKFELALEDFVKNYIATGTQYEEMYEETIDFLSYTEARDPDPSLPWKLDVLWHIIQMAIYDQELLA